MHVFTDDNLRLFWFLRDQKTFLKTFDLYKFCTRRTTSSIMQNFLVPTILALWKFCQEKRRAVWWEQLNGSSLKAQDSVAVVIQLAKQQLRGKGLCNLLGSSLIENWTQHHPNAAKAPQLTIFRWRYTKSLQFPRETKMNISPWKENEGNTKKEFKCNKERQQTFPLQTYNRNTIFLSSFETEISVFHLSEDWLWFEYSLSPFSTFMYSSHNPSEGFRARKS